MSGHTPGPWSVALDTDGFTNIVSPNADGTLELMIAECYGPQDVQEANARLIAAAPALLALVEKLDQRLSGIQHYSECKTAKEEAAAMRADLRQVLAAVREGEK